MFVFSVSDILISKMSSPGVEEEEEVEVRGLLNRHRNRILIDLENSAMLTVLVKKNVISVITEALLNNYPSGDQQRKCDLLVDTIAKSGFRKFKEFCYAIEEECPELIHEMINDKSAEPSNGNKDSGVLDVSLCKLLFRL